MTIRKTAKGVIATAAVLAVAVPALAQAQTYGTSAYANTGAYYDVCGRDTTNRSTTGALVGAGLGAVIGSQVASNGVRTEGSVLGGLVGALIGSSVGRSSAACSPQYVAPRAQSNYYAPRVQSPYSAPRYSYDYGNSYSGYTGYNSGYSTYSDRNYDSRVTTETYNYYAPPRPVDTCRMVDSPVRMPDGRTQTRLVKVCPDSQGRYQIVD